MKICNYACEFVRLFIERTRGNARIQRHGIGVGMMFCLLFAASNAAALGIGAAQVDSHIGERLRVLIPLNNLSYPNSLKLDVNHRSQGSSDTIRLTSSLVQEGDNYSVLIGTERVVKEPYIEFSLTVDHDAQRAQRDFTVLLNLGTAAAAETSQAAAIEQSADYTLVATGNRAPGIMGPYDWAQAGNIPEKFGAVLDGQSLWRVARRINKAMGVSVDQMMIALYESNPQAFASESIDSLQAGSYLTIPDHQFAIRFTERQAQARVKSLSGTSAPANTVAQAETNLPSVESPDLSVSPVLQLSADELTPDDVSISPAADDPNNTEIITTENQAIAHLESEQSVNQFSVTDIDSAAVAALVENGANENTQSASSSLIDSLSASVTSLTQELYNKDRKIKVLEEQVYQLQQAQNTAQAQNADLLSLNSSTESRSISAWWLLPFALIVISGFFFRERINRQLVELNLFGRNEKLRFRTGTSRQPVGEITGFVSQNDYSMMSALEKAPAQDEVVGVSLVEIDQLEDEVDQALAESTVEKDEGMEFSEVDFDDDSEFTIDFFADSDSASKTKVEGGDEEVETEFETKVEQSFSQDQFTALLTQSAANNGKVSLDQDESEEFETQAVEDDAAEAQEDDITAMPAFDELEDLEDQPGVQTKETDDVIADAKVEPSDKLIFADDTDRLQVNVAEAIAQEAAMDTSETEGDVVPPAPTEAKQSTQEELEFSKRIDTLLAQRDYRFARELIDFARHNDISDDRYHYERMRLCLAMDDQDAFYDYYFNIESQIGNFDADLQIGVADLISRLGQYH
ncbi:MAG: FimV/HubP family polar landmark protein [Pseudomonadota bacterium]